MDFTKFINSKDVREYHRKIGYEYNSLEAAWLVSQSYKTTLKEKHEALQWILDNMPDLVVKDSEFHWEKENGKPVPVRTSLHGKTLHEYIKVYMEMQDSCIAKMKEGGKDIVYIIEFLYEYEHGDRNRERYEEIFSNWDSCIDFISNYTKGSEIVIAEISTVTIGKDYNGKCIGTVEVSPDGEIKNVEVYGDKDLGDFVDPQVFFEDQWLEFPVPFSKGDIVCVNEGNWYTSCPVVLEDMNLTDWEHGDKRIEVSKEHGCDVSDMCLAGECMIDSDVSYGVYHEVFSNYMDAEYCNDLTGANKCLKPISSFLKGEFGVDLLLGAYQHLMTKELCNLQRQELDNYIKEAQKAAGVLES